MSRLTYEQWRAYAAAAGAPDPDTAAAIVMAESGGESTRHNAIPPDDSYGGWQINMLGSMGPARRKALGITSNSQLYDPATNARAMMLVSSGGTDFRPWTTYQNGSYKKYMKNGSATADPAVWGIPSIPYPDQWIPDLLSGGDAITDSFNWVGSAASWISKASNWVRIGYVVGGGILVVVGLAMVVKDQEVSQVARVAGKVGGKVLGGGGKAIGRGGKALIKKARSSGKEEEDDSE